MDASTQEAYLKKKLQGFLTEMFKIGTVKGFLYFDTYLRGREEMILSVVNQPQVSNSQICTTEKVQSAMRKMSKTESFSSHHLPYDQRSLMLSIQSQMALSTHGIKEVGLPPASPSDGESVPLNENSTFFLIAGYGRYNCPYAWVRSNHERLVKLTGDCDREKDSPLKLKSTLKWKDSEVYVWDLIAEIVKLCTFPAPRNPFAVDFDYFSILPPAEQVLATAAMINCLQKILLHTPDEKQYAGKVFEELQLITKQHYTALEKLIQNHGVPILQQQQQQQQQRQQSQTRGGQGPARPRDHSAYSRPNTGAAPSIQYGYSAKGQY